MNQDYSGFGQQSGPDMKRILIAGLLMSVAMMVFGQFFAPPQKQATQEKEPQVIAKKEIEEVAPAPAPLAPAELEPSVVATSDTLPLVQTSFEIPVMNSIIEGDPAWPRGGYQLGLDNLGARIGRLFVFGYSQPIPLFDGPNSGAFLLKARGSGVTLNEKSGYELTQSGPNEAIYERVTPEGLRIIRRYRFKNDNYLMSHEIEVKNESQQARRLDLDLVFRTDGEIPESSYFAPSSQDHNFLSYKDGTLIRHAQSEFIENPLKLTGPAKFIAFEQRYFLLSVLPKDPSKVFKILAESQDLDKNAQTIASTITMSLKPVELSPNASYKWEFDSYAGPKQLGLLKLVGHGLEEAVNFGWFGVISRPLLWLLVQIYGLVHNFGIAIILLTLLIKMLTYPLTQKSFVSMQQVKKISPEIKALEKKYGHDRTTLSQKQMELYREKGVNPMAGCLPMFLQIPVWIALYQMLSNSIEIYQKPFAGWITDLTQPDPYYVLPVLMGISMIVQQLLQPVQDDQKAMKYAMLGTSFLFAFIMLSLPSGLSLYMFTNNILTVIQQLVIKKRFEERTA